MKANMFYAAVLALVCMLPARAAEKREQYFNVGATVDAQGRITVTDFDPDVPKPVTDLLTQVMKQWRFVAAKSDGKPVPAHTFIYAKVEAVPDAHGNYGLRVIYSGNGPKLVKNIVPTYPKKALRQRQSGFLFLTVTVNVDGSLTDMTVSRQFDHWPVLPAFQDAALAAVKQWHAVPEQVDGRPVKTRVRIPCNFTLTSAGAIYTDDQVRWLRDAARKRDSVDALAGVPLPSEQTAALDSPLQPSAVASINSAP
jgi:TonB family protein